jgi:hypothetical protein
LHRMCSSLFASVTTWIPASGENRNDEKSITNTP